VDEWIFGTAMESSICVTKILDAAFLKCWKATSFADTFDGLYKKADVNGINLSKCISRNR